MMSFCQTLKGVYFKIYSSGQEIRLTKNEASYMQLMLINQLFFFAFS